MHRALSATQYALQRIKKVVVWVCEIGHLLRRSWRQLLDLVVYEGDRLLLSGGEVLLVEFVEVVHLPAGGCGEAI